MIQLKKQIDQAVLEDHKQLMEQYNRFKARYDLYFDGRATEDLSAEDFPPVIHELWRLLAALEQMQGTQRTLDRLTEIAST